MLELMLYFVCFLAEAEGAKAPRWEPDKTPYEHKVGAPVDKQKYKDLPRLIKLYC